MAVIFQSLTTVKPVAATPPNVTSVAPVKPAPRIVTVLPPASGPPYVWTLVTLGTGCEEPFSSTNVNQLFAFLKKWPPAPIPMMRAVICRLRSTSGTSNAMIRIEAITRLHDSSQPRNGCTMRLVNT